MEVQKFRIIPAHFNPCFYLHIPWCSLNFIQLFCLGVLHNRVVTLGNYNVLIRAYVCHELDSIVNQYKLLQHNFVEKKSQKS